MLEQAVILLAEDSQDDVTLIRKGFAKANLLNPLQVVTNGEETINYLKGEGTYSNRAEYPLPDLLLLEFENARPGRLRRIALDSPTAGSRAVTCSSPDLLGSH